MSDSENSNLSFNIDEILCYGDSLATLYIDFDTTGLGLQYPFTYILTDDNTEGIYSETIVDDALCNPNCFNHVFNDIYAGQYTLTIFDSNFVT